MKINDYIKFIFAILIIISLCSFDSVRGCSYVANLAEKLLLDETSELIGGVNMIGEDEAIGVYLNNREISGYDTCTYHSDGDYIDANGNEVQFNMGKPALDDITVGFRFNMGSEILTTGTKYSSLFILHGVTKDVDGDLVPEFFSAKDSMNERQEIFRNYHESNLVRVYSYIDGASSYKEYTISNLSWNDMRIEMDFINEADNSDVLYVVKTYLNNTLCGVIEIPETITMAIPSSVVGSMGATVNISGEVNIDGPYLLNFLTANGTLLKDAYIYDGNGRKQNSFESVSLKTDFLDRIIVNEQFADSTTEENFEMLNFGVATNKIGNGYMTLSYKGDGSKTGNDLVASPVIRIGDERACNKYIFRAKYKFNDFKVERCIAQLFSGSGENTVSHAPLLKTAKGSTMKQSELLLTYIDDNDTAVVKKANVKNDIWYSVQITIDISNEYPSYDVFVENASGETIFNEHIAVDKTSVLPNDNSVYMQIRMNDSLDEINALSETSTMYLDDIYLASILSVEGVRSDDLKIFDGCDVVDTDLPHTFGEDIKLSALISNCNLFNIPGNIIACQYSKDNELLFIDYEEFSVAKAYDPYVSNSFPTSEAVSLNLKIKKDTLYIKIFIVNSLEELIPYTKYFILYV